MAASPRTGEIAAAFKTFEVLYCTLAEASGTAASGGLCVWQGTWSAAQSARFVEESWLEQHMACGGIGGNKPAPTN